MDWDTACRSLDTLSETGCSIVVFEGGEPLLWSDGEHTFRDLALYAHKRFASTAVTTNGTLPLDVPTDILWVSIDGSRDTHNRLRSDSYDCVMKNINSAKHSKLLVHVTLNSLNWREFPAIVRTVTAIPVVKGITVQVFYPYNQVEGSLILMGQERKEALETVLSMKRAGYPILNSTWGLKVMINNSWSCRERLLANVSPDGSMAQGCYVLNRSKVRCSQCGFTPVAEASGAYGLKAGPILAGLRIFLMH